MIGQKVRLASGGPEMIVVDIEVNTLHCLCSWKNNGKIEESWFPIVCLDIIRGKIILI